MAERKISVIGLGGVGSILINFLSRYLNWVKDDSYTITLIDGDEYEEKNLLRQEFTIFTNKAEAKREELQAKFPNIVFECVNEHISEDNLYKLDSSDTIFICVDNHTTRALLNGYAKMRDNLVVISGGNEYTDGNVQIYARFGGKDVTPDLAAYHPEIATPSDKHPDEMSCEELHSSSPQLLFTNMSVATLMLWAYYSTFVSHSVGVSEIYFDMITMKVDCKIRQIK
jgi:prephenate dehydrogenase